MELKEIKCTIETVNITIALNKDSVIRDEIAGIFADGYQIFTGKPYIGMHGNNHISGNHREYIQKYSLQNINNKWIARYATCVSGNNYVIEVDENPDLTEQLRELKKRFFDNGNGTVTCRNKRLEVTLPKETFEQLGRERVFTVAMLTLGNQSELKLLRKETSYEDYLLKTAAEAAFADALLQNCRHDFLETIRRYHGNHRLSIGQQADIDLALSEAEKNIADPEKRQRYIDIAKGSAETELNYRTKMSKNDWHIQIIGNMPEQIGTCRFQQKTERKEV